MSPPLFLRGEPRGDASLSDLHELSSARLELPADAQQLIGTSTMLNQLSLAGTLSELSRIRGTEELPEDSEEISRILDETLEQTLDDAAETGNPASYITAMRLFAGMVPGAGGGEGGSEAADSARAQALRLAEAGAEAIENSDLTSREKVTRLYDLTVALAGALARPTREPVPEAETNAMSGLFRRILQAIERNEVAANAPRATVRPTPPYMRSYCEAQLAMLEGNVTEAFAHLLETRRIITALGPIPEDQATGIRAQIMMGTEHAIQALPRDNSGSVASSFRSRMGWELLGYFYQVDYMNEHGDDQAEAAMRLGAQFNLVAGLAEDAGITPDEESGEFSDEGDEARGEVSERGHLIRLMETLYTANEDLRNLVATWGLGELETKEDRAAAFTAILENAAGVYSHIHEHRETAPYQEILAWQENQDLTERAAEALGENAELKIALCRILGLPSAAAPELPNEFLASSLMEYGALLPTLLEQLPEGIREDEDHDAFFDLVERGARGLTEDGMEENLTTPTEDLFGILDSLRETHDDYEPAFGAFYHSLAETEEIRPGVEIPGALRTRARGEAEEIESFNWRRVVEHVASPESIAMILGGAVFAELGSMWLLARAGTAGNYGRMVQGGHILWRGEMAIGIATAVGMSAFSTITHLATTERPVGEEFSRIGPGVAIGTLVSSVALGLTIGANRRIGGALFGPRSRLATSRFGNPISLGAGRWALSTGVGSGLMLGAGTVTGRIMTGEWHTPTGEEAAEMFLTMALWDLSARGIRGLGSRWWWRRQIGPHRAREVDALVDGIRNHPRNASMSAEDVAFLRNYFGMRMARGHGLEDVSAALRRGEEIVFEGNGATRTLRFRVPGSPAPEAAALQSIVASPEFQHTMDGIYREVVARLRALPRLGRVRIRMTRDGDAIRPEILTREDGSDDAENTFEMGPDGVPVNLESLRDPLIRDLMRSYGEYLRENGLAANRLELFNRAGSRPRPAARPALGGGEGTGMTRAQATQVVLGASEAELALAREINASEDYQAALRMATRSVRRLARSSWVLATRDGNEVDFHLSAEEPTAGDNQVAFRMDTLGRITNLRQGDAVLRAVIQATPQQHILPPSAGADTGGRAAETEATSAQRPVEGGAPPPRDRHREPTATFQTQGRREGSQAGARPREEAPPRTSDDEYEMVDPDAEVLPELSPGNSRPPEGAAGPTARPPDPLAPPPIPREAQALPPPLPPARPPARPEPAAEAEGRPEPSPRPRRLTPDSDTESTAAMDMGSLLESDLMARATDTLVDAARARSAQAPGAPIFVEISPGTEHIFRIIEPSHMRTGSSSRGYFILGREPIDPRDPSGSFRLVIQGSPILPRAWRDSPLIEYLRSVFAD